MPGGAIGTVLEYQTETREFVAGPVSHGEGARPGGRCLCLPQPAAERPEAIERRPGVDEQVLGEFQRLAVLSAQVVETDRLGPVSVEHVEKADDVALRFRHLLAAEV